jgi:hypothetical protein
VIKSKLLYALATLPLAMAATIADTNNAAYAAGLVCTEPTACVTKGSVLNITGSLYLPDPTTIQFCPQSLTGLGCATPVDSFFPGSDVANALVDTIGNTGTFEGLNSPNPGFPPSFPSLPYVAKLRSLTLGNTSQFNRFLQLAAVIPNGTTEPGPAVPLINFNLSTLDIGPLVDRGSFITFDVDGTGNFLTWGSNGEQWKTKGVFQFTAQFSKTVFEDVFGDQNGDGKINSSRTSTFSVSLNALEDPTRVPEPMSLGGAAVAVGAVGLLKRKRTAKTSA